MFRMSFITLYVLCLTIYKTRDNLVNYTCAKLSHILVQHLIQNFFSGFG